MRKEGVLYSTWLSDRDLRENLRQWGLELVRIGASIIDSNAGLE